MDRILLDCGPRSFQLDNPAGRYGQRRDRCRWRLAAAILLCFLELSWSQIPAPDLIPNPGSKIQRRFRNFSSENGLDSGAPLSMFQDSTGFLWTGGESGLIRYDGQTFKRFGLEDGVPAGVLAIIEDARGIIWAGSRGGLVCREGERFNLAGGDLARIWTDKLIIGPEGRVWFNTTRGPCQVLADGGTALLAGWPAQDATSLAADAVNHQYWIAGLQLSSGRPEAVVFSWRQGRWNEIGFRTPPGATPIVSMALDGRGRLWARSNAGLWWLPPGGSRFEPGPRNFPPNGSYSFLFPARDGGLFAPVDSGIARLRGDQWILQSWDEGYPLTSVAAVLEDREGAVWLCRAALHQELGQGMMELYSARTGLPREFVWSILRDRRGQLWLGTDQGLVRQTKQGWELVPGTRELIIRSLAESPAGNIFMAGTESVLVELNPASMTLRRHAINRSTARIFRLLFDHRGQLWLGTNKAGLLKASSQNDGFRFEPVQPAGVAMEEIRDVWEDSRRRLWVASRQGMACLENGQWRHFTAKDGLLQDHVVCTRILTNGDLLTAYYESIGMTRFRYTDGRLQLLHHLQPRQELLSGMVYSFQEDRQGNVWCNTAGGVDLLMPQGHVHYGTSEGFPCDDTSAHAGLCDYNGDVWIGTSMGLVRFKAIKRGAGFQPLAAKITAAGKNRGGEYIPLATSGEIQLDHEYNTVILQFVGLSLLSPRRHEAQTRLVGLEAEWSPNTTWQARYPALSPGAYRFEVRARCGPGDPWGPVTTLKIEVRPAWWQTWWFKAANLLILAGIVYLLVLMRLRTLHQAKAELEHVVADRTRELAEANEQLRNQSLTDPLTGLRNRRFLTITIHQDTAQVVRLYRDATERRDRMPLNKDLVFLMVDIDHFKFVNDEYGHAAGDRLLQKFSDLLRQSTRESDNIIRWGGEEFLVIARNACRDDASILAERIRAKVEECRFELEDGQILHRTCSLGFAPFPFRPQNPQSLSWEQVVDIADQCLYTAKRSGRNAWVGLLAVDELLDGAGKEPVPSRLPRLVKEGAVQLLTNLPDPELLRWE